MPIASCPKTYTKDQDKAFSPSQTLEKVLHRLEQLDIAVLGELKRVDTGRLGIPVYLSVCAADAKLVMPTRKQMGKGASAEQAKASALMELMERYGFFSFWDRKPGAVRATWDEAEQRLGAGLLPLAEVIKACHDTLDEETARRILNLRKWLFFPALRVKDGATVYLPLDLFKQLGEFNGSSAGNADAESILQGACELVERHVCDVADAAKPVLPTISQEGVADPVLSGLIEQFAKNGIRLLLKDFTLGSPVPTVAALAYDPETFPHRSELVYTAGTAATPEKAAIRAVTEVAQLAGDFYTGACYEASGLPKYATLEEASWLQGGPLVPLSSLPRIEADDIRDELLDLAGKLDAQGYTLYAVDTTNPDTQVPSHYNIIPGFRFRERDTNASLGLFTGRMIAEEEGFEKGMERINLLESLQPGAHYLPFFRGLLHLRAQEFNEAAACFAKAEPLQPESDATALAAFYTGYALTMKGEWDKALPHLDRAVELCPEMKEYLNLRGVSLFKQGEYEKAARDFSTILRTLDKGSVMDIMNLGMCHKFMGDMDQARHYLTQALRIDPGLHAAQKHLAELPPKEKG